MEKPASTLTAGKNTIDPEEKARLRQAKIEAAMKAKQQREAKA